MLQGRSTLLRLCSHILSPAYLRWGRKRRNLLRLNQFESIPDSILQEGWFGLR
jgi:hypothetical protein